MDARATAAALVTARLCLGLGLLLGRRPLARLAFGGAPPGEVELLWRMAAGRDAALGLGGVLALRHDAPVRGWIEAAALADAVDVYAFARARGLTRAFRWASMLSAGAAAVLGAVSARRV